MKDYVVKIVRQGELHIRAKSAEEAACMAGRYGFGSNNFELHVEINRSTAEQNDKEAGGGKKRKKSIKLLSSLMMTSLSKRL